MPLYEYVCYDCQHSFDTIRPMSKADAPIQCKECESMNTGRQLSKIAVRSSGEGLSLDLQPSNSSSGGGCCGGSCGCSH